MASSNPDSPLPPPSLNELSMRNAAAFLLPLIRALNPPREVGVLIHPPSRTIALVEGPIEVQALLREFSARQGPLPATKALVDALTLVPVSEPGLECPICLLEFEVNVEAKQMPCGHQFHGGCVDRWLGIHRSCPVCRFSFPLDPMGSYERDGFRTSMYHFQGPRAEGLDQGGLGTGLDEGQEVADDGSDYDSSEGSGDDSSSDDDSDDEGGDDSSESSGDDGSSDDEGGNVESSDDESGDDEVADNGGEDEVTDDGGEDEQVVAEDMELDHID